MAKFKEDEEKDEAVDDDEEFADDCDKDKEEIVEDDSY